MMVYCQTNGSIAEKSSMALRDSILPVHLEHMIVFGCQDLNHTLGAVFVSSRQQVAPHAHL